MIIGLVETTKISVSEEEVKAELDKVVEQNARMINIDDRPVKDGDITSIDFDGYVDGEQFEGGKAENHSQQLEARVLLMVLKNNLLARILVKKLKLM